MKSFRKNIRRKIFQPEKKIPDFMISFMSIMRKHFIVTPAIFLSFCFNSKPASAADTLFYNNKYSVACHNCYEKKYSSSLEDALKYTSALYQIDFELSLNVCILFALWQDLQNLLQLPKVWLN